MSLNQGYSERVLVGCGRVALWKIKKTKPSPKIFQKFFLIQNFFKDFFKKHNLLVLKFKLYHKTGIFLKFDIKNH